MNTGLRETLARMQEAESVEAIAVADADGMLVASVANDGHDLESLAASAGGTLSFMAALGADAGLGDTRQATIEYSEGTLFVGPLGADAFLLIVAAKDSPLGQVRLILRRYRSELETQLGTPQA